jgi:hypothetical protein
MGQRDVGLFAGFLKHHPVQEQETEADVANGYFNGSGLHPSKSGIQF